MYPERQHLENAQIINIINNRTLNEFRLMLSTLEFKLKNISVLLRYSPSAISKNIKINQYALFVLKRCRSGRK